MLQRTSHGLNCCLVSKRSMLLLRSVHSALRDLCNDIHGGLLRILQVCCNQSSNVDAATEVDPCHNAIISCQSWSI
jgi:hypothetical protein